MNLLDYHHLRNDEVRSWDRDRLRHEAGPAFTSAAEPLLPTHEEPWSRDKLVHFTREPWFDACLRLSDLYAAATDTQRTWLRSRIDRNIAGKLNLFALRAAVLAAREHSPALAHAALVACAVTDLIEGDIRDVLIGLSLISHCAALAGADVPALFRAAAALAGPAMRALYDNWAVRYPDVQPIASMGWQPIDTDQGIGFRML